LEGKEANTKKGGKGEERIRTSPPYAREGGKAKKKRRRRAKKSKRTTWSGLQYLRKI